MHTGRRLRAARTPPPRIFFEFEDFDIEGLAGS